MTYNDIPITSAQFLDNPSMKNEEDVSVVQARVADERDQQGNQPTIAVPATSVTITDSNPPSNNRPNGNIVHPTIAALKERRKRNQKIALVAGFVVGCIICGPILGVIGAGATHAIVKYRGRAKQARKEEELMKSNQYVVEDSDRKELS